MCSIETSWSTQFTMPTILQIPSQPKPKTIIIQIIRIPKRNPNGFQSLTKNRHLKSRVNDINTKTRSTETRNRFIGRRNERGGAIEVSKVLDGVVIMEGGEGEIKVEENSVDAVIGVNEVELFGFVRD